MITSEYDIERTQGMHHTLRECRRNFGSPPRRISLWERWTNLRVPKPIWLRVHASDELNTLYANLKFLWEEGEIVWGHVIQANELMFRPGTENCPGELVYSLSDPHMDPQELAEIAHSLFSLKGTDTSDPLLDPIADYLTDEYIRVFGMRVPSSISPNSRCRISTTLFVRNHLPRKRLCCSLLPTLVSPEAPHVALPLPEQFWPDDFHEWWQQI